jgi:hypothetical protein
MRDKMNDKYFTYSKELDSWVQWTDKEAWLQNYGKLKRKPRKLRRLYWSQMNDALKKSTPFERKLDTIIHFYNNHMFGLNRIIEIPDWLKTDYPEDEDPPYKRKKIILHDDDDEDDLPRDMTERESLLIDKQIYLDQLGEINKKLKSKKATPQMKLEKDAILDLIYKTDLALYFAV